MNKKQNYTAPLCESYSLQAEGVMTVSVTEGLGAEFNGFNMEQLW